MRAHVDMQAGERTGRFPGRLKQSTLGSLCRGGIAIVIGQLVTGNSINKQWCFAHLGEGQIRQSNMVVELV